jgi:hypothetical protein
VKPITVGSSPMGLTAMALCAVLTVLFAFPPGSNWILSAARKTTVRPERPQAAAMNRLP